MSFKEDLEKRRKAEADAQAQDAEAREQRNNARATLADALERHLSGKEVADVGLQMQRDGARIVLKHDKYQIHIDVDVQHYNISKLVPDRSSGFGQLRSIEKRKVTTVEQVDACILEIIEAGSK